MKLPARLALVASAGTLLVAGLARGHGASSFSQMTIDSKRLNHRAELPSLTFLRGPDAGTQGGLPLTQGLPQ